MESNDSLISSEGDYVLAKTRANYVVYLKNGGESTLDLGDNNLEFEVQWYNPRKGGPLKQGKIKAISGSGPQSLGMPPKEKDQDWVVLVVKKI